MRKTSEEIGTYAISAIFGVVAGVIFGVAGIFTIWTVLFCGCYAVFVHILIKKRRL